MSSATAVSGWSKLAGFMSNPFLREQEAMSGYHTTTSDLEDPRQLSGNHVCIVFLLQI